MTVDTICWRRVSLHQRYERRTTNAYGYEASQFNYAALLTVRSSGFVSVYPGLWEEER